MNLSPLQIFLHRAAFVIWMVMGCLGPVQAQTPDSFDPRPNDWVASAVVQTDGRIIIGGVFTAVTNQTRGRVARVNADGSVDPTFANPNAGNHVYTLALQPDGKVLVGGLFTSLAGSSRVGIGRLNTNGTLDNGFNMTLSAPPPGYTRSIGIHSILAQRDGKIIVGGRSDFTPSPPTQPPISSGFNLRLEPNGVIDGTFSTAGGVNERVAAMALQSDGKILLGGDFTTLRNVSRQRLGRLNGNGTLDTNFIAHVNGSVFAIAIQADDKILVGGNFTMISGQFHTNLARLNPDGTLDNTYVPAIGSSTSVVNSLAVQADGKVLLGGYFITTVNGQPVMNLARLNPSGALDPTFTAGATSTVVGLAIQPDGKLLVAGNFSQLGGQSRGYIGRLNATGPAIQSLGYSNTTVTWLRGGTSPEVTRTWFELSAGTTNWQSLGDGVRIANGWQLAGVNVPANGIIRAKGSVTGGGFNGSTWIVQEQLSLALRIVTSDGLFGFGSGSTFGFTVNASGHSNVVVESSSDLAQWLAVKTNAVSGSSTFYFQAPTAAGSEKRFYRARRL